MPKSVPLMKCNFCEDPLRQHEAFACYSCLSEYCPKIRDIALRQMALKDEDLPNVAWKPDVRRCVPLYNPGTFHSLPLNHGHHRHAWNV